MKQRRRSRKRSSSCKKRSSKRSIRRPRSSRLSRRRLLSSSFERPSKKDTFQPILVVDDTSFTSSSPLSNEGCPYIRSLGDLEGKIQELQRKLSNHSESLGKTASRIQMVRSKHAAIRPEDLHETEQEVFSEIDSLSTTLDFYKYVHFFKRRRSG